MVSQRSKEPGSKDLKSLEFIKDSSKDSSGEPLIHETKLFDKKPSDTKSTLYELQEKSTLEFNTTASNQLEVFLVQIDKNGAVRKTKLFVITQCDTTLHRQLLLSDDNGRTLLTLRSKNFTAHGRWNGYRGESTAPQEKIFSASYNGIIRNHNQVKVSFKKEINSAVDFNFKGKFSDKKCTIFNGDSSTMIAEVSSLENKDNFSVEVHPNTNYVTVVGVIAAVYGMKSAGKMKSVAGLAIDLTAKVAGGAAIGLGKWLFDTFF